MLLNVLSYPNNRQYTLSIDSGIGCGIVAEAPFCKGFTSRKKEM